MHTENELYIIYLWECLGHRGFQKNGLQNALLIIVIILETKKFFDRIMEDLADSKTSALLALAKHKPLSNLKAKHLKFAAVSLEVAQMIQDTFFPKDTLTYEELGCEEYDICFGEKIKKKVISSPH